MFTSEDRKEERAGECGMTEAVYPVIAWHERMREELYQENTERREFRTHCKVQTLLNVVE